jgi:hypothetical protein
MNDVNVSKDFNSFSVSLRDGSKAKKRLSNRLTISVPTDRADVTITLTAREARALQNFLSEHLNS